VRPHVNAHSIDLVSGQIVATSTRSVPSKPVSKPGDGRIGRCLKT
jgi:hypothetical protein